MQDLNSEIRKRVPLYFGSASSASQSSDHVGCWCAGGPNKMLGNTESLMCFKCLFLTP